MSDAYIPDQQVIQEQIRDAMNGDEVTCPPCNRDLPLHALFRCLYCGTWFCQSCAEKHFGKTREEYNRKHFSERMVKRDE